jgi:chromosome segregation ATPase
MKTSFLTNLLIVFALGLCALCTFQWLRETESRKIIQTLHNQTYKLESEIQQHTNNIHHMDVRINDLTLLISQLENTIKTNELQIQDLRSETNSLSHSNLVYLAQIDVYTDAYSEATNRLAKAFEDIKKQNDLINEVAAQRNEFVEKLNTCITERNDIVNQYNDLVKQVELFQAQMEQQQQGRSRR